MNTRTVIDHRTGGASPARATRHPEKANRPDNPIQRKPDWIRVKAPNHPVYHETRALMRANRLTTVCEEAACPNIGECWSQRHATMMIMGDTCTRACAFCNVATGQPNPLDHGEPGIRTRIHSGFLAKGVSGRATFSGCRGRAGDLS